MNNLNASELISQLNDLAYANHGSTPYYELQINVITGLLSLSFLVIAASLVIRISRGGFWIIRREETSIGKLFVTVHAVHSYLIFQMMFIIVGIIDLHLHLAWLVVGTDLRGTIYVSPAPSSFLSFAHFKFSRNFDSAIRIVN
jgi:hypothetical protein